MLGLAGICATALYFAYIYFAFGTDLSNLKGLEPNELGDFLAGVFGPPAFVWIVISFYLQSKELSNSVSALRTQSQELKISATHQEKLASAALEQIEQERIQFEKESDRILRAEGGHIIVRPRYERTVSSTGEEYSRLCIYDMVNVGGPVAHSNITILTQCSAP